MELMLRLDIFKRTFLSYAKDVTHAEKLFTNWCGAVNSLLS